MKRLAIWQNKLLSFGGRFIWISHVLQTMPVYLLSAMNPPVGVINQMHKIFTKFQWGILHEQKISIGFHEKECASQRRKVDQDLDHCMIHQKLFLQSFGGFLELPHHPYRDLLCGINIARRNILQWLSDMEPHILTEK